MTKEGGIGGLTVHLAFPADPLDEAAIQRTHFRMSDALRLQLEAASRLSTVQGLPAKLPPDLAEPGEAPGGFGALCTSWLQGRRGSVTAL